MELEINRTHISCYETVADTTLCQEETQEAIVPDACPDILRIIEVCGQSFLTGKQARDGMVMVSGTVEATVLYVPEGESGVRRMELRVPFDCQVDAPGLTGQGTVSASSRLRCAEARALNPRKILLRAEVIVDVTAYQPCQVKYCQSARNLEGEGLHQLVEQKNSYQITAVEEKPFSFSEQVRLTGQGELGELLAVRATPVCTESKLIGSKLIFKGNIELQLLMRETDGALEVSHHQMPFSQIMEMPGVGEEGDCDVRVDLVDLIARPAPESGRSFEVRLELLAQSVVRCRQSIELLRDIYSTLWELEAESEAFVLPQLEDWSMRPVSVREVLETPEPVRQIVDSWVTVGETKSSQEGGQAAFANEMRLTILYLDESGQLQSIQRPVIVAARVDSPAGALCKARCQVSGEIYATFTAGGIEVRFTAEFQCLILGHKRVSAVSAARLTTPRKRGEGEQPSVVLRLATPGERLWDIAKHYGTTTDQIIQANDLEESALPTGQMLLIPRAR